MLRIIFTGSLLFFLASCQEKHDHDGSISVEPEIFIGYEGITNQLILRDGLFYKPFETRPFSGRYENRTDGYLAWEQTYEKGKPVGIRRAWHKNGQLKSETRIDISYREFDQSGALVQQTNNKGDHWLYTFYDKKGNVSSVACLPSGDTKTVSLELCNKSSLPNNGLEQ